MEASLKDAGTVEDQELLSAMPSKDFCEYARRCSGCYDVRQVLDMTVDGGSLSIYEHQGRSSDTCVGADARLVRASNRP